MSEEVQRVEVITSVQRRRRWSVAEKIRLVEETLQPGTSVSFVARKHGLSPSLLFNWRRRMAEGGREAVRVDDEVVGAARMRQLEERIRELERLLGRKTMEVEILKEALAAARGKKTAVALAVVRSGRFPMKAVADTLQVARSNLAAQAQRGGGRPRPPYRKAGDAELLARIRFLVDARPSYGYRRITALLNRQADAEGLARVNHKRVYRVMKRAGLLLAPHTGRGRQQPHDGEVATPASNRRWAADVFEIPCWNGEAVRVAFAIDTHDREILAWTASPRGIGGIAVRDLMLLAVERRFAALRAPQPVEWLADNGSCFTAHETLAFAHAIGLVPCFTPVRSPESNGIAEAFVKTFKRDYVRLNARPDAAAVMAALDRWFEDYNEMHPHRALGMRSPRQFIRAHPPAACPV
ncbi:MAG: IS3 family transposase [Thermoleophilaceae bacterium]